VKFDGHRLQAHVQTGQVTLYTRSGLDWTHRFGKTLPAAVGALKLQDAVIDGEVVVEARRVAQLPSLARRAGRR
jgi:bifunctional non-homologous end joining protein LigD